MDNTETIDTEELMARLLQVIPPCWLDKLAESLERVVSETGHGEVAVIVYRGKVRQINRLIKDR